MGNQQNAGIVAFGFGEPASTMPNLRIAACTADLSRAKDVSMVFTDRDVASHLVCEVMSVKEIDPERVPTTYRLAATAVKEAKTQQVVKLYVVTTPCHLWRCLRDLRWASHEQKVAIEFVPQPIESYHQYDSDAITVFTRRASCWWPVELAYRVASTIYPAWYKRTRA